MKAMFTYVQWGRQECTNGHELEYNGLVMGTHYSQRKSEHVCVDYERMGHARSDAGDQNGGLLYTTEVCTAATSAALPPPPPPPAPPVTPPITASTSSSTGFTDARRLRR